MSKIIFLFFILINCVISADPAEDAKDCAGSSKERRNSKYAGRNDRDVTFSIISCNCVLNHSNFQTIATNQS